MLYLYTATEDEDFTGLPDVIVFEAGDFEGAMSCKNITIIDDNIREGVENFTVKLSSDFDGVTVSRGLAVVEISDNDGGIHVVKNKLHFNDTPSIIRSVYYRSLPGKCP